jgi:hypothetical protein
MVLSHSAFAIYGISLSIPESWTVEINPKGNRQKCDVAFHTPDGTKFYVSWGILEEAQKRFKTLDEHVDYSLNQVKKGRDVDSVKVEQRSEGKINGHRSVFTKVSVMIRSGFFGRTLIKRTFLSTHFYCPDLSRFYVVYMLSGTSQVDEESMSNIYEEVLNSLRCHQP